FFFYTLSYNSDATELYTLSLHDALPISSKGIMISIFAGVLMSLFYRFIAASMDMENFEAPTAGMMTPYTAVVIFAVGIFISNFRSEEHTSELQSRENIVCRLLLEKKN